MDSSHPNPSIPAKQWEKTKYKRVTKMLGKIFCHLLDLFINFTSVASPLQHRDINHSCKLKLGSVTSPNVLKVFFRPVKKYFSYFLRDDCWKRQFASESNVSEKEEIQIQISLCLMLNLHTSTTKRNILKPFCNPFIVKVIPGKCELTQEHETNPSKGGFWMPPGCLLIFNTSWKQTMCWKSNHDVPVPELALRLHAD